jgi:cytidylate kinase
MLVVEKMGGPRTGKGSCAGYLASSLPGAALEETGADYRAVTLGLLTESLILPEMPDDKIIEVVAGIPTERIAEYAAERYAIVATMGEQALYGEGVSKTVATLSPLSNVRTAVKDGFKTRLRRHMANGVELLIVDGRNLSPLVEAVGAEILIRAFVDCSIPKAVMREAARLCIADTITDEQYKVLYDDIYNRRIKDESRAEDAAVPDQNPKPINYWFKNESLKLTIEQTARRYGCSLHRATEIMTESRLGGRVGVGALAVRTGRQVYFDTSDIPKDQMLRYSLRMTEEALEEHSRIAGSGR